MLPVAKKRMREALDGHIRDREQSIEDDAKLLLECFAVFSF